ncbi:MAG: M20 family metallopeptidase [Flexistipes sinusarabici]|uniref:M20 family metallopeptidase n=1 Tax=Flexistipes sinusarabici TaxID=2352 RepID=A0A5D0MQP5_FLESI|nr:M20/M25/M40 family metallo-hydrolase [Flexistipes sinusarabici]TYB34031.1 MAG: M20 family metallopeptidase [Flexistipes sinusarabici]
MINSERLQKLLTEMIDIYSPSGKETELTDFLQLYMKEHNLPYEFQEVESERGNIIVMPESGECDTIFVGHIDTVPAFDYENYESDIYENEIYGLGAVDMKGGCAAMIESFLSFQENNKKDFTAGLALVVGEEESGDGAYALSKDYSFRWAVIGEPTNLQPCYGHFGYVEIALAAYGQKVHASLSKPDKNAVKKMMDYLNIIINYIEKDVSDIIYNIRDLSSSQAGFATPDRCEAYLDLHLPTRYPIGVLTAEIEDLIFRSFKNNEVNYSLETIHHGFELTEKGMLPQLIKQIFEKQKFEYKPFFFKSDSDAPILWQSGIKPIILGPGDISYAHTKEEYINFNEVEKAAETYLSIMNEL